MYKVRCKKDSRKKLGNFYDIIGLEWSFWHKTKALVCFHGFSPKKNSGNVQNEGTVEAYLEQSFEQYTAQLADAWET